MAEKEQEEDSKVNRPPSDLPSRFLPFVEVVCKSSGKTCRFAAGTEAGFAVSLINRKVEGGPIASHIEAVKEGEEPVSFGPNSVLVNYGDGWKLQTVTEAEGLRKGEFNRPTMLHNASVREASQPVISYLYVGKILLAFILIFAMGAVLTLALENLPRLILFINSSL
ncbi:uncharacterized protein LOC131319063 isoform X2 [Rhododendron vialii]|uniref:uncharacterized protein LOC131319063 isoform X2 n=1 Tax=Rhododendron vialii TaxID=182163 RepID=UPI00265F0849|nr:uncharacterized protein LOC131319063 isoform X2 [Rhododendron vialii]